MLKNYIIVNISLTLKTVNYSHQNPIILYSAENSTVSCHCRSRVEFYYIYIYIRTYIHNVKFHPRRGH